jgi:FtsP/CotA-like multicopper oxidase with cupredoxin domain
MSPKANASPPEIETQPRRGANRRAFLAGLGFGTAGVGGLVATAGFGWPQRANPRSDEHAAPVTTAADTAMTDEEMNVHHREGIEQFLANIENPITSGVGAVDAEWTMDGDTRVFELTCSEIEWEVTPDMKVQALAYNGMVPGPTIRCKEGERVRVIVHNEMEQSTAVHWHGQKVPNNMDGVPFITQEPIRPGETFTYEFIADPAGTHMYHSHHNSTEQVGRGLLGALIVEPKDPSVDPEYDRDYIMILNDSLGGYTLNGKGFPATQAYVANLGERIRFRFMNEGQLIHPMHLHGMPMRVFARDGWPVPQPYMLDTLNIAPGERWDVIVEADLPGIWAFHCHILSHAEGPMGMFGMVTVLVVNDPNAGPAEASDTSAGESAGASNDTTGAVTASTHAEH